MLNLNEMGGFGSEREAFSPTVPGTPLIHFKAENIGASSWVNSGSGGATYNATAVGTLAAGLPMSGFGSYQLEEGEYYELATEYVLPNTCMLVFMERKHANGNSCFSQKSATGGGATLLGSDASYRPFVVDSAGIYLFATDPIKNSIGKPYCFRRTGATTFQVYVGKTLVGTLTYGFGTFRIQRVGCSSALYTFTGRTMDVLEVLVYPDLTTSANDALTYLEQKFGAYI